MNKQQTKIIKEMEKGKSFEKACELASVSQTMVHNWIKLGQRGNKGYEEKVMMHIILSLIMM